MYAPRPGGAKCKAVSGRITQFTCTLQGSNGGVVGPLGAHLLLAVANLIAKGLQVEVVLLEPGCAAYSACPPPQADDMHEIARTSKSIKELRQLYSEVLLAEVQKYDNNPLRAIELIEDDALLDACNTAKADFKTN